MKKNSRSGVRTLSNSFHDNLRPARRRMGLTQAQLADASGITLSYVSMMERGERTPALETIDALAKALGIPAVDLLR